MHTICAYLLKKKHELADGQANEALDAIKLHIVMNCIDQNMLPNVHQLLPSSAASLRKKNQANYLRQMQQKF